MRNIILLVRDNLKLPDDGGEIPKSQGRGLVVRIPTMKSPLYLMEKLVRWSITSCALTLACWPCLEKEKVKEKERVMCKAHGLSVIRIR